MIGMDRNTGKMLSGDAHLAQSIADILTTPLGTRPMRRDYGSLLPNLVDKAVNRLGRMRSIAATATALRLWEPRIAVRKVTLDGDFAAGQINVNIEGTRTDVPSPNSFVSLSVPLRPSLIA